MQVVDLLTSLEVQKIELMFWPADGYEHEYPTLALKDKNDTLRMIRPTYFRFGLKKRELGIPVFAREECNLRRAAEHSEKPASNHQVGEGAAHLRHKD